MPEKQNCGISGWRYADNPDSDQDVVNESSILKVKFCAEKPAHRNPAKYQRSI
jgi:hypothetical protein